MSRGSILFVVVVIVFCVCVCVSRRCLLARLNLDLQNRTEIQLHHYHCQYHIATFPSLLLILGM